MKLNPSIIPKGQRQCAAFFLNLLHWKWCCWRANEQGFIQLKSEYLTRVIPREVWPGLWHRLEALGVIDVENRVHHGGRHARCRGYRLASDYRETKRIECTNDALARRIREVYAKERGPELPVHRWLAGKLDLIEFDMESAEKIVATLRPDEDSTVSVDEYRLKLTETCRRIANRDHWCVCDRFGRVHTPITSLAKELRSCLRVDGQRLMGLDLANSQPLIAGICARQFYRSKMTAVRLRQRQFRPKGNPYHRRSPQPCQPDAAAPDLAEYIRLCEAGRLYESLMGAGESRDRVKRRFLTAMYGKNHWRDRIKDRLTERCPSVAGMLASLKAGNYRHASHVIQNAEACIFIHGIADRIRRERPELPVYMIHDSAFTVPDAVGFVRSIILDEFKRLGITPTLKPETCK